MKDRIDYACDCCGKVLSAPASWIGRPVTCPVCGNAARVPEVGLAGTDDREPGEDIDEAVPDIVFSRPDLIVEAKPLDRPDPGFFRRYRVYIIAGAVVLVLGGWWASWGWYYRHYVKAEAIMRNRGYGTQLSAPLANDPKVEALTAAAFAAEGRQFADPDNLDLSIALAAAYDDVLKEIGHVQKDRANHILNNAAWLFATSPHLGLRDYRRALSLAQSAVVGTCRKDAGYLDTLAEAFAVNGQPVNALEFAREAQRLKPDDAYLNDRLKHFEEINAKQP